MIYYYFGDKDGLYLQALENAYRTVRDGENALETGDLRRGKRCGGSSSSPSTTTASTRISSDGDDREHPSRAVSRSLGGHPRPHVTAIDHIASIYQRGVREGAFRPGLDPLELHWQVSALCFFNVSNRATFSKIFGRDMGSDADQAKLRENTVDMLLRFVAAG